MDGQLKLVVLKHDWLLVAIMLTNFPHFLTDFANYFSTNLRNCQSKSPCRSGGKKHEWKRGQSVCVWQWVGRIERGKQTDIPIKKFKCSTAIIVELLYCTGVITEPVTCLALVHPPITSHRSDHSYTVHSKIRKIKHSLYLCNK